jgi:hypothetical protein
VAARNIQIRGDDIEPKGEAWDNATPADRRAYYQRAGELALVIKRDEIRRGIGYDGKPLEPVLPSSRPDGAKGKPLDPHYARSRTYRLLAMRVATNGVTLFWHSGHGRKQKLPWATILGYHADGVVIGAPMRDVVSSISPAGMRKLKARALQWWANFIASRRPKPTPKAKAKIIDVTDASASAAPSRAISTLTYREFDPNDPEGMIAWTQEAFGAWGKSLTRHERAAIDRYSSRAFGKVNGLLRDGGKDLTPRARRDYRRVTARMDAAIAKGEIPENIVVWRGMSAKRLPEGLAEGTVIEDKAFASTSLSRAVAEDPDFAKGALLKLRVPAGTHAASTQVAAGFGREFELILPRDGKMKVTKVTKTATGHLIEADWLPGRAAEPAKGVEPKPTPKPESTERPKPAITPPVAAKPAIGQPRKSPVPQVKVKAPAVVHLKAGQKPKFPSKSIQVYGE